MDMLAAVMLENWVVLVLILLSCGSLVLALWCFMFMASEKRMVEELQSMGSGFQGLDNRLGEIQQHVSRKIDDLEVRTHTLVSETRDSMQRDIQDAGTRADKGLEAITHISSALTATEESFSAFRDDVNTSMKANVDQIGEQVTSLQTGIVRLEVDLKKSIKDQVSSSIQQLDATILAVLETIQHEMLRGVDRLRDIQDVVVSRNETRAQDAEDPTESEDDAMPILEEEDGDESEGPDNIIAAEPLFACLASRREPAVKEEPPVPEAEVAFLPEEIVVSADTLAPEDALMELTVEDVEAAVEADAEPVELDEDDTPPVTKVATGQHGHPDLTEGFEPVDIIERLGLFDEDDIDTEDDDDLL